MDLRTRHFGGIQVDDSKVIRFEEGLPGFPDDREFVLIVDEDDSQKNDKNMFYWLQSVNDGDTAFPMINVYNIMPSYNPMVVKDQVEEIEAMGDNLEIYNIVTIPEDAKKMTVNLKAPVVINNKTNKGKQVILNNDEYGVRHYIFDQMQSR